MITTPEQMREAVIAKLEYLQDVSGRNQDGDFYVGEEAACFAASVIDDAVNAIRSIPIAPQPVAVTVKPLVWEDPCSANNWVYVARSVFGDYYVSIDGGKHSAWLEANLRPYENKIGDDVGSVWAAKELANADYDARTRALVQPSDPLSDPRVVALVEAAKRALNNLENTESEFGITLESADSLRSSLRAIGGKT